MRLEHDLNSSIYRSRLDAERYPKILTVIRNLYFSKKLKLDPEKIRAYSEKLIKKHLRQYIERYFFGIIRGIFLKIIEGDNSSLITYRTEEVGLAKNSLTIEERRLRKDLESCDSPLLNELLWDMYMNDELSDYNLEFFLATAIPLQRYVDDKNSEAAK